MDHPPAFTVAFDDADGEGIVFFGNYFRFAHRALERWLPSVGVPWAEWFRRAGEGAPLVHAECDYREPLRPGDTFFAEVRVGRVGASSVTFHFEFKSGDGRAFAKLTTVHAFIDRASHRKTGIPDPIRERLAPLAEHQG